MAGKGANSWKNRSKKAKAKAKSLLKKKENQRCPGCLNKSCPKKFNKDEDKCEYVSVCDKCMVIVNPGTIKFCQSGCRKKMKLTNLCPQHPEEFRMFGGVCKKCMPNAIVESISAESLNESEEPQNRETLLVISNSDIAFDKFKVATEGESEIVHLFGGNNRMVECIVDSKNNSNEN